MNGTHYDCTQLDTSIFEQFYLLCDTDLFGEDHFDTMYERVQELAELVELELVELVELELAELVELELVQELGD